jgi:hypothetical protein
MDLFSNGSCSLWSYTGTRDLKDGKLVIDLPNATLPLTYNYSYIFSNNDGTLSLNLTNGDLPIIFTNQ